MKKTIRQIRIEGNVACVPLTKGYEAIIDAEDVPLVDGWNWYSVVSRLSNGSVRTVYAARDTWADGRKGNAIFMHKAILGAGLDNEVDHRDGDGLNNTRSNLRKATSTENRCNQKKRVTNVSGYKGVSWDARNKKWRAQIVFNGKSFSIGRFVNIEDAARAYADASQAIHGDFGRTA